VPLEDVDTSNRESWAATHDDNDVVAEREMVSKASA
jgi:hypothetical protein